MDLKEVTADEKEQVWNQVCTLFHNDDTSSTRPTILVCPF